MASNVRAEQLLVLACADHNCTKTFNSYSAKESHQRKWHQIYDGQLVRGEMGSGLLGVAGATGCISCEVDHILKERAREDLQGINDYAMYCLNSWEFERFVPQSVKQDIKRDVQDLHQQRLAQLKGRVQAEVQRKGAAANLDAVFKEFENFWPGCETLTQERRRLKNTLSFVEPTEVLLGQSQYQYKDSYGEVHTAQQQDRCIMFSFEKQLEAVLQCEPLYEAMQEYSAKRFSSDGMVRSCFDAAQWQGDPFFTAFVDAYTVKFYYDDVTVTNPIGHYKRKVRAA